MVVHSTFALNFLGSVEREDDPLTPMSKHDKGHSRGWPLCKQHDSDELMCSAELP